MEKPLFILGAGATKACNGPLTDEILPAALNGKMADDYARTLVQDREQLLHLTRKFLADCFNVPENKYRIEKEDCPSLPMVLSMLHRSIEQNQPLGDWPPAELVKAKRALEYSIFAVIEATLRDGDFNQDLHKQLLAPLYRKQIEPAVVSLNYDVIVDNAMFGLNEQFIGEVGPEYNVDIATQQYRTLTQRGTFGHLFKIHGSLNWLYCNKCKRLDLFLSEGMRTAKALNELYHSVAFDDAYSCRGTPCRNNNCDGFVSPILITPTFVKDYENPHVANVWAKAEAAMKSCTRAIFIGYSLPTDDIEVAMLFKRGLNHLHRQDITVVEYVEADLDKPSVDRTPLTRHPTGQRFRGLFGDGIDWHTVGFKHWMDEQEEHNKFPFN